MMKTMPLMLCFCGVLLSTGQAQSCPDDPDVDLCDWEISTTFGPSAVPSTASTSNAQVFTVYSSLLMGLLTLLVSRAQPGGLNLMVAPLALGTSGMLPVVVSQVTEMQRGTVKEMHKA
eukprot:gnl/TRDRNA2_/TRDRNA2_127693_c0_seq1.p1 gnl/TRDRNA2_/TRDRNA2_127693_c0~~gnl/TRDRNA2_/TRDRNA2_127693_c0_seq1.p1  ORF type:complete len:118 (+),score=15.34 gnl/TRDRNA2_/TRDRNA2_127693_c0_seq1:3-356(+)